MILVDERVGSRELLDGILRLGVQAELGGRLDADFQFEGRGGTGDILIGVERKAVQDALDSMRDRRFLGAQLPTMARTYDVVVYIVEGRWRKARDSGFLELGVGKGWVQPKGTFRYRELTHYLMRLSDLGVIVWRTHDADETAAWIVDLYEHYQQPWEKRDRETKVVYAPAPEIKQRGHRLRLFARREPTFKEKVVQQLPGVDGRAIDLAKHFPNGRAVANATVDDWLKIKGLRIGKKVAQNIVDAWQREE